MFIGTQVISFNDSLYQLVKVLHDQPDIPIDDMKEYYNCNTTLRREGKLYFCRLIEEAQVITDEQI